jgi:hypothetical protein
MKKRMKLNKTWNHNGISKRELIKLYQRSYDQFRIKDKGAAHKRLEELKNR